jgi:hypothetical protein
MPDRARHMPYFVLLEALQQPGCALCRLLSSDTRRYLDGLLYESVNDSGFRNVWLTSRGFCHRHAWMMAESANGLGLGILYLALIERWGRRLLDEAPPAYCPVCAHEIKSLRSHVGILEGYWADPDFAAAWEVSDGFCGPHLRWCLRTTRRADIRLSIVNLADRRIGELVSDLRALIDSFDYQHAPVADDRVRFAWRRAIEMIAGHRDMPETPKGWKPE